MAPQREWFEKDYYATLGVSDGADDKAITAAYRALAKRYHPDRNKGDSEAEERFKEVAAAYDVLGDADKRKEYDEVRRMVASGIGPDGPGGGSAGFGPGGHQNVRFDFEDGGGLGDILGGLFGGGGSAGGRGARGRRRGGAARQPRRGDDLVTELHLDFLEAVHGITTAVSFTSDAVCTECHGSGAKPGTFPEACTTCGGSGSVAIDQGPFSFSEVCPTCGGSGLVVKDKCLQCKGAGVERRAREVKVRIPAGVDDGQRIRVKERGGAGAFGGPPGDLFVKVHVRPDARFGRKGRDLTLAVPVTFVEAALGAKVRIPTLGDPVTVKVPAGTQSGKTVRVRRRGIETAKATGDLLVTFEVVVPTKLDGAQKEAVESLAQAFPGDPRADLLEASP
ncbi:MAG TPA: molecular chaperone DnaJ [Acidimicrobiia bacterium]|nr:molecular chaperone DnaJ [Acidimicrobiia bacterium]